MQDKFVGDVGDFGKYGLLRTLAGIEPKAKPGYRLGIVWYLRPEVKLRYLRKPEFHSYDEDLCGVLLDIVDGQTRTVKEVKSREILGEDAVFFTGHVPNRSKRREWLCRALEKTRDTQIVLLDPDNGLDPCEVEEKKQLSTKHAYLNEVRPFVQRGQTVVVYQSYRRRKGDTPETEVLSWRHERLADFDLDEHPRVIGTGDRAFVVLPATRHVEHIDRRLARFVERWGKHFKHREL